MSRRRFLWLLSAGGAAAVLAACTGTRVPAETLAPTAPAAEMLPWFKDPDPFIVRGTSGLEARLENLDGLITPERFFFVRNNSVSLEVAVDDWSLSITGDAVPAAVEMSYDDVLAMESRTLEAYLECAGNHRAMFDLVNGQAAEGTQWGTGAVGNATWTGVPLADVLRAAGISDDALSVMLIGMDVDSPEMGVRRFGTWVLAPPGGGIESVIQLIAEEVMPRVRAAANCL